jgi:hypothetical protein
MIKKYNNISLAIGAPGLIIQIYGGIMQIPVIGLVGSILLVIGLTFYAKAKARHPAWGLLGLLSIIGLIILAILPDKSSDESIKNISLFTTILLVFMLVVILAAIIIPMIAGN